VWLVHPANSQAVVYVWQRSTSLAAALFVASLWCYLEARWGGHRQRLILFAASLSLGLLALAAKENAGALPLFVLLLEAAFRPPGTKLDRRSVLRASALVGAFLGIAAVYLGPRFVALMAGEFERRGFSPIERLLTESRVVVHYLTLLALPLPKRLNLDYEFPLSTSLLSPPSTLASLAVVAALPGVAIAQFHSRRLLSLAILWFFGNLAIESTVVPLDLVYEHRLYLPSMLPLVSLAGLLVTRLAGRPVMRALAVVTPLLLLSAASARRAHVWADPVRLFADNAAKSPNKARVHANLGLAYLDRQDYPAARAAFARALELDPALTGASNNLALIHLDQLGQPHEARRLLEEAVRHDPQDAGTRVNLATACWEAGDQREAVSQLEVARELDPEDPRIPHNLAVGLLGLGDVAGARAVLDEARARWPEDASLRDLWAEVEPGTRQ
jgi:tetratricopeptide (TPR) repeat protein